ncbi:hypothetical protein IJ670_01935 [bacterium]|nr:hypothetical protein [bacterium]
MKKIVVSALLCTFLFFNAPFASAAVGIIEARTPVNLKTAGIFSTQTLKTGDSVKLYVNGDIKDSEGNILIKSQSPATGKVLSSVDRGKVGRPGKISIGEFQATAIDGSQIALTGTLDYEAESRMKRSIVLSAVIIPFFLFMKGKSAEIPAGTIKTCYTVKEAYVNIYQY